MGIRIDNCSKSNKHKIVKKLKGHVEQALDFVDTYGVIPKKLVCETFDGRKCTVNIDSHKEQTTYENMSVSEKEEVKKILHVCDTIMVSEAAYHELSMHIEEMPRKGLLISCRKEINASMT